MASDAIDELAFDDWRWGLRGPNVVITYGWLNTVVS